MRPVLSENSADGITAKRASMVEARAFARRAKQAKPALAEFSHEHLDDLRVIFRI